MKSTKTIITKTESKKETKKTEYEVADWVIDIIAKKVPALKMIYNLKKLTK